MRILIVTASLPYPPDAGGRVRQYNLLKRLALRHEITLISFIDSLDELKYVPIVEQFCSRVETVLRKQPVCVSRSKTVDRLLRLKQIIHSLFTKIPSQLIQSFESFEMKSRITELMEVETFDLLQVDFTQMAGYLPERCPIPSVLVEHDIMFKKYYRLFQASPSPLVKAQALIDYFKVKKFELDKCRGYEKVITMSTEDKNFLLRHLPGLDVSVVPNGVDTSYFGTVEGASNSNNIVFVGGMKHSPNLDAVNYFYERIFPLVKERTPFARLWIIGGDGPEALQLLTNDKSVIVTGYVEDIRPHLTDCGAFIVPLRIAGGTRLKILEAMAAGCPVISTSIGAEGLEVTDKENILIADTPEEFAEATVEVLANGELQKRLGDGARKLTARKYNWEGIVKLQDNLYSELVERSER